LASNPTILVGACPAITFDTLDKAAYHLHDMLTRDPAFINLIVNSDKSLTTLDVSALAYARKIFYFRYLISGGLGGGSMLGLFYQICTSSPGFLDALMLARDLECTDPRDRIYGLWNLAQDKSGLDLTPGYSKSYEQVYLDFVKAWSLQHKSLDILGAVEATYRSLPFYQTAPSWCPNWNVPSTASSLLRKDYLPARFMSAMQDQSGKLYAADGTANHATLDSPLFHSKKMPFTAPASSSIASTACLATPQKYHRDLLQNPHGGFTTGLTDWSRCIAHAVQMCTKIRIELFAP
jgi:hypothetical protein